MTPAALQQALGLDAVTRERLEAYVALLAKWQPRINLVAPATLAEVWSRHILDSGQFHALSAGPAGPGPALGSGAGFPGMVLAVLGPSAGVLAHADQRLAAVVRTTARPTQTTGTARGRRQGP